MNRSLVRLLPLLLLAAPARPALSQPPSAGAPAIREARVKPVIFDSESASLDATVEAPQRRYTARVSWGDGTKEQVATVRRRRLALKHDYDLLGTFRVRLEVCAAPGRCAEAPPLEITVVDDDTEGPTVKLDMPRGPVAENVPRRVGWDISDPSGLSIVQVDFAAPDDFQQTSTDARGQFDFGDRGLGGYGLFVKAIDGDADRPGDQAGGPNLHTFVVVGDPDGDRVLSNVDNCPATANPDQADRDFDGFGDACDDCPDLAGRHPDGDGDGVGDPCDNCPQLPNRGQGNADGDLLGDACDDDADNDGLGAEEEKRYGTDPGRRDTDRGGTPDGREVELGLDPRDPRDDQKPPEEVVNRFANDRLLVRFAYALPEREVGRIVGELGAKVQRALPTAGVYELALPPGTQVEEFIRRLSALQGPSEEIHHGEQLTYPVADYLGTFEGTAPQLPDDPRFPHQTGFAALPEAWRVERGQGDRDGVVIALIDTGLDLEHEDLRDNVWRNEDEAPGDANGDGCPGACRKDDDGDGLADFEDPEVRELLARTGDRAHAADDDDENGYPDDLHGWDFASDSPAIVDTLGHGTHVAGVVAATGDNATGVAGVLWRARLMPLKVDRGDGLAELQAIARAMRYAGQNGAEIVLHSYVITLHDPSEAALAELRALFGRTGTKHLLHVAAAGNQGRDLGRKRRQPQGGLRDLLSDEGFFVFPVSLGVETVVSVAAHDETATELARFSNRGEGVVQMAAPGVNVLSTLPGNRYGFRDGTSVAAGYMTGVMGLLLSRYPELRHRPGEAVGFLRQRATEFANPEILTSLFYQLTHPPVLTGTLYDETPFRFPGGFCGENTYDADLFDADGDGDLDLLEVNGNPGSGINEPRLFRNLGGGRYVRAATALAGGALTNTNLLAADQADADGDGDQDLVFASFTPPAPAANMKEILLRNQGGLNFTDASGELPDNFDVSRDVDFCDFDGDGRPDLYVTNVGTDRILRNDSGPGGACWGNAVDCFSDQTSAWLPTGENGDGHNTECLDVDDDGDLDLFVANLNTTSTAGQNLLLINRLNEGVAAFVNETGLWNVPIENDTSHMVAAADIDDDNNDSTYGGAGDDLDLVLARRQFGAAGLPQNNKVLIDSGALFLDQTFGADGLPGGAPDRLPNLPEASTEAALCDIDGDGDPDLLEANGDANYDVRVQNRFYENQTAAGVDAGGEGFFAQQTSQIGIPLGYVQQSTDVDCGDVDGDGDTDVLFSNYGGCPELYINSTAETTPAITGIAPANTLVGERVTITGTDFGPFQGVAGRVTFGGVDAGTVYHWTDTRIAVDVPVGCDGNGTPGTCNGGGVPTPTPKGTVAVMVRSAVGKTSAGSNVTVGCFGGPPVGGVCPGVLAAFTPGTTGADADCSDDPMVTGFCLPEVFCRESDNCNEPGLDAALDDRDIKDVEFGDLDNDGDLDVFDVSSPNNVSHNCSPVTDFDFPDRLLINQGSAEYHDITGGPDHDWGTKAGNPVPDFLSNRTYDADLADINNDGLLDLVRADHQFCPGEFHYFVNKGGTPLDFDGGSFGIITMHAYWCEVAPGDVDGDGDLDLLFGKVGTGVANAIVLNRHHQGGDCNTPNDCFEVWNPQTAAPTHCPDPDDPADPIDSVDCRDDLHTFTDRSHDLAWADLDGDRDLDVVVGGGTGQGPVTPVVNRVLLNRLVETGEMFFEQVPIPNEAVADPTTGVLTADFNGDGRLDVHLANYAAGPALTQADKLYLNLGRVDCGPPEASCGDGLACPACGPGTNHVVCNRLCWRDASSQLPEQLSMPSTLLFSYGSDYGDVDGDGDLDYIAASEFSDDSRLVVNQGFKPAVATSPTWIACPTLPGAGVCAAAGGAFPATATPADHDLGMYFGDADGDGDLDIIWGSFEADFGPFLLENNAVP